MPWSHHRIHHNSSSPYLRFIHLPYYCTLTIPLELHTLYAFTILWPHHCIHPHHTTVLSPYHSKSTYSVCLHYTLTTSLYTLSPYISPYFFTIPSPHHSALPPYQSVIPHYTHITPIHVHRHYTIPHHTTPSPHPIIIQQHHTRSLNTQMIANPLLKAARCDVVVAPSLGWLLRPHTPAQHLPHP